MSPPIRRFAPIGAVHAAIALVAATAFLALAHDRSHPGRRFAQHPQPTWRGGSVPGGNDAAMKKMMSDMAITPPATSMGISWQ